MRFLVNKEWSAAARPLGTVSHSAAFGLVISFKGLGHQLGRVYQKLSNGPLMDVGLRTRC